MTSQAAEEIAAGARFGFGENWARFLSGLTEERIAEAVLSLQRMLEATDLTGKTFLDIGSGSGIFSLAARRLGARVHSFDFDAQSVGCAFELRRRYCPDERLWTVQQGSILDAEYVASLGRFDVVYSWGVLHHTGDLWRALDHAAARVADGGKLFIALYNNQGRMSRYWYWTKRGYCWLPKPGKLVVLLFSAVGLWGPATLRDFAIGAPFRTWRNYKASRGMSPWHDLVDWVGGYPFEVSKPEEVFQFCRRRGFQLSVLSTCAGRHGCNEFVFDRISAGASDQ